MRTISAEELKDILGKHKKWLNGEYGGGRADLRYANLYNANLYNADLRYADLRYAYLSNANLSNANLSYADLRYADLSNAKLDEKEKTRCGWLVKEEFHAYKICRDDLIVELIIPKGSIVFSINNSKCRTNRAKVVSITDIDGKVTYKEAVSKQDENFIYKVGVELEIEDFNLMYNVECAEGIHFFRTREEAVNY